MTQQTNPLLDILVKLESIQREIGVVQESLMRILSGEAPAEGEHKAQAALAENLGIVEVEGEEPREEEAPFEECVDPEQWLSKRGITVKARREESGLDEAFDRLCTFLGERFESLAPFYRAITRSLSSGGQRAVDLTEAAPQVISDTVQFAYMLRDFGFLAKAEYVRRDRRLFFIPQRSGQVTNFFTGGWLERYVLHSARERARVHFGGKAEPLVLLGPQVTLPDNRDFEFDILVGIPEAILWFECKTGDWGEHVTKYGDVYKKYMKGDSCVATLVLLETLTPEQKRSASVLAGGMHVINLPELEGHLNTILVERSIPGVPEPAGGPPSSGQ